MGKTQIDECTTLRLKSEMMRMEKGEREWKVSNQYTVTVPSPIIADRPPATLLYRLKLKIQVNVLVLGTRLVHISMGALTLQHYPAKVVVFS